MVPTMALIDPYAEERAFIATLLYRKANRPPQRPCLTPRLDDWQC
jgi:hypothetical protein